MSTVTTFNSTETVITTEMEQIHRLNKIRNAKRRFRQGRIGFAKLKSLLQAYKQSAV